MFDESTYGPYEKAEMKAREAFELFEQGQIIQAISCLDEAIEINPSNGAWHFNKAISLDALNRFEDAIKEYQAALELNPGDPEILNSIAMDYTRIGLYDLAIEIFEQIQQIDPAFEPAYCNRIITYTEMGRHDTAEEMFYLAQQINPDCPVCFYNIGNNLFIRGDYKRAVHCWEKTAQLEPTHPQINFRIAQAYWMLGDKDHAQKYFLKELRCCPGDIEVLLEFGVFLLQSGEVESAKEKFNRIIELEPDYPAALFYLGEIAFNNSDYTAAASFYEKARSKDTALKGPAYRLAQCALTAGNKPEAKAYLTAELGLAPECPDVLVSMGTMFLSLDCIDHAFNCFMRAVVADSSSCDAHYYLGLASAMRNKFDDAANFFTHTLEINPRYIPALRDSALVYLNKGLAGKAVERINKAIELAPHDCSLKIIGYAAKLAGLREKFFLLLGKLKPQFSKIK